MAMNANTFTPETYEAPRMGTIDTTIAIVKVGTDGKTYNVHKALLCASSENFAAALNGPFKEGRENTIVLDDMEGKSFRRYLDWLYRGRFFNSNLEVVVDLHIFADRYLIPQLKRATVDMMIEDPSQVPRYRTVARAFRELPESSPMCDLIVQRYLSIFKLACDKNNNDQDRKDLPTAFLLKLFLGYAKQKGEKNNSYEWQEDPCKWHEHKTEKDSEACKKKRAVRKAKGVR
ncbi:hypothetical protein NA57DRAFT_54909 [Rhizodiscina lignyota]|uniref:BTB domain-containing protein n=1 Tax=Rhizodiscina lignyota TaxID=1504668 RepID=A0A9P4IFW7_9PEZI|nr:hypothetical protein NA57DRAFT_54909 [Rhizodiscina lignyota]